MEISQGATGNTTKNIHRHLQLLLFGCLLGLTLVNRIIILFTANQMVDSDQPFMWLGTRDYAMGQFYEPRFYGQDYNTFFEGLVAVPFYKLGMPVYYAVPLATHLLFLTPLFVTLIFAYKAGRGWQAISAAAVLLYFTTAFDILSSLPRGFVGGLFFCSGYIFSYLKPEKLSVHLINLTLTVIGYYITPNLLLAAAPLAFFIFYHNYKRPALYLMAILAVLEFAGLYFVFDYFYVKHPEYVVYGLVNDFSLTYFFQNIQHLDQCFAHVSFFVEDNSIPLLVALMLMVVLTRLRDKSLFYTWLFFLVTLLLSFFAGKTRDGSFWPYYSYSRMYMAMPLIFLQYLVMLPYLGKTFYTSMVSMALAFESYKLLRAHDAIAYHTNHHHAKGVRITSVPTVIDAIATYKKFCVDHGVTELKISTIFWLSPYLTYGAQTIDPEFPNTEETWADRRYWVRLGKQDSHFKKFIIISINYDFDKITQGKYPFDVTRLDDYGVFLIDNNQLSNKAFMDVLRDIED